MRKESKANIPDFATHYFLSVRRPFLNLSDLDEPELSDVIRDLQALRRDGGNSRRFGRTYLLWRRATEEKMYELFVEAGGKPERRAPHYLVLGSCRWYEQLAPNTREIRISLRELPSRVTSFTYPDSFAAMRLGPRFGQPYWPQPYHGQVNRMEALASQIDKYGLPDDSPDHDYDDFHLRPFEKYIEIQLWSDEPVARYLSDPWTPA